MSQDGPRAPCGPLRQAPPESPPRAADAPPRPPLGEVLRRLHVAEVAIHQGHHPVGTRGRLQDARRRPLRARPGRPGGRAARAEGAPRRPPPVQRHRGRCSASGDRSLGTRRGASGPGSATWTRATPKNPGAGLQRKPVRRPRRARRRSARAARHSPRAVRGEAFPTAPCSTSVTPWPRAASASARRPGQSESSPGGGPRHQRRVAGEDEKLGDGARLPVQDEAREPRVHVRGTVPARPPTPARCRLA